MVGHTLHIALWKANRYCSPRRPIRVGCMRLKLTNRKDCIGRLQSGACLSNQICCGRIAQFSAHELFLSREFSTNQFLSNPQSNSRLVGERLSAAQSRIGWTNGTRCREHRTIAVEHYKSGVLVCQPSKRGQRNHSVGPDHDQAPETVSHTRKSGASAVGSDSIVHSQVAAFDKHSDAVSVKCNDAVTRDKPFSRGNCCCDGGYKGHGS